MAPKDKAVDLTAESSTSKKNVNSKKKNDTSTDIIKLDDAMSDEDRDLKERLETCVQTILENVKNTDVTISTSDVGNIALKEQALQMITTELRTATASMTSVPKPLKFLRPFYGALKAYYEANSLVTSATSTADTNIQQQVLQFRAKFADVMSVLAMTMGTPEGAFSNAPLRFSQKEAFFVKSPTHP
jgi:26S proteasome regulatory subunit N1